MRVQQTIADWEEETGEHRAELANPRSINNEENVSLGAKQREEEAKRGVIGTGHGGRNKWP